MRRLIGVIFEIFLLMALICHNYHHHHQCYGMILPRTTNSIDTTLSEISNDNKNINDYPDYHLGVKYDEYPLIIPKKKAIAIDDDIPKKRTALLVDRLLVALQQAIEEEEAAVHSEANRITALPLKSFNLSPDEVRKMDLQRRGHGNIVEQQKGRIYWRCYFNAVTCF